VQHRLVKPPASFANSRGVTTTASLALLAAGLFLGSTLVGWRWRVWDQAEAARFFERADTRVLEPQFIVFLFVTGMVAEVMLLGATGWLGALRRATYTEVGLFVVRIGAFASIAAAWWLLRAWLGYAFRGEFTILSLQRGLGAAAAACVFVTPILARRTFVPITSPALQSFIGDPAALTVVLGIVVIGVSGLWSHIAPAAAKLSHAGSAQPAAAPADVAPV